MNAENLICFHGDLIAGISALCSFYITFKTINYNVF